jgi:hypothetical protein
LDGRFSGHPPRVAVAASPRIALLAVRHRPRALLQVRVSAAVGAGLIALWVALVASFFGPVTVPTYGTPSSGAQPELRLLDFIPLAGAISVGVAAWRAPRMLTTFVILAGVVRMFAGIYLSFGIWTRVGDGWSYAPYTLEGAPVLIWGFWTLFFGALFAKLPPRSTHAASGAQGPAR